MNRFEIVTDTSNDLEKSYIEEHGIKTASFYITVDGEVHLKDQIEISAEELYKIMRSTSNLFPKTSQPSAYDYEQLYRPILESGKDILCFTIAETLSGSNQSAHIAADTLKPEFPDRKIEVIDSRSASLGLGKLIESAVRLRDIGVGLEDCAERVREQAQTSGIFIVLNTLDYLENGGRIGKTSAFAAGLLNLKPIVSFENSDLKFNSAARGMKKAVEKAKNLIDDRIKDDPNSYELFVIHGDALELANEIVVDLEEKYNTVINQAPPLVCATVISHVGPGVVALGYIKKHI